MCCDQVAQLVVSTMTAGPNPVKKVQIREIPLVPLLETADLLSVILLPRSLPAHNILFTLRFLPAARLLKLPPANPQGQLSLPSGPVASLVALWQRNQSQLIRT